MVGQAVTYMMMVSTSVSQSVRSFSRQPQIACIETFHRAFVIHAKFLLKTRTILLLLPTTSVQPKPQFWFRSNTETEPQNDNFEMIKHKHQLVSQELQSSTTNSMHRNFSSSVCYSCKVSIEDENNPTTPTYYQCTTENSIFDRELSRSYTYLQSGG